MGVVSSLGPVDTLATGASHVRTDTSEEPETMRVPSVENATEVTESVWPFRVASCAPVKASHTRTDLSSEPETMRVPSVENPTE